MNMNRCISLIAILIVSLLFLSCGDSSKSAKLEREQYVKDSIARAESIRDSIVKRRQFVFDSIARVEDSIARVKNAEVIKTHKSLFIEKKDEFSNYTWVEPKDAPKYRNRNGVYCYFKLENGIASSFRFVYQYYADDWLFIKNMIFNFDGENNITIVPKMETDCGDGGMIWEWCDEFVSSLSNVNGIDEEFIKSIANAKSVKVKMNGKQYYDTRTLTAKQIKSIKDTYEYYIALGGKFNY